MAATTIACSRGAGGVDRSVGDAGQPRGVNERIVLRGCLQPAPTGGGFALTHVVPAQPESQPAEQDAMEHHRVARGSWVRVTGDRDDVQHHLGNEVTITGDIADTGANTIGTSGHDQPLQGAPGASVANGDAPQVAIEKLEKVAENCAGA